MFPTFQGHSKLLKTACIGDPELFSVALGAGQDSRVLAKHFELRNVVCTCGREWPSRTHVTWHCPNHTVDLPEVARPSTVSEERLLIRAIASPPRPLDRDPSFLQPHAGLCELFSSGETFPDGILLVATDGSSRLVGPVRRAAWAVATQEGVQAERLTGIYGSAHFFG